MNRNRGFTIIELMIVIVIVAIGVALAVPSFRDLIERKAVGGAAEAAYEQLQLARSQALKRSKPILVDFHVNGTNWAIGFTDRMTGCNAESINPPSAACTIEYDNITDFSSADNFLMRIQGVNHKNITMTKAADFLSPAALTGGCKTATGLSIDRGCFDFVRGLARTGAYVFASANYKLQVEVTPLGHVKICIPAGEKNVVGYDYNCTL